MCWHVLFEGENDPHYSKGLFFLLLLFLLLLSLLLPSVMQESVDSFGEGFFASLIYHYVTFLKNNRQLTRSVTRMFEVATSNRKLYQFCD